MKGSVETGEKCCNCDSDPEPVSYEKLSAGMHGEAALTAAVPGLGIAIQAPRKKLGWGFYVKGKIEMGLVGRGKFEASGSINHSDSKCPEDEACTQGGVQGSGAIQGVGTFLLEASIADCFNDDLNSCMDLFGLKGETTVGFFANATMSGSVFKGTNCPASCASGKLSKAGMLAKVEAQIMLAGIYEATYSHVHEEVLWEDKPIGGGCGG